MLILGLEFVCKIYLSSSIKKIWGVIKWKSGLTVIRRSSGLDASTGLTGSGWVLRPKGSSLDLVQKRQRVVG